MALSYGPMRRVFILATGLTAMAMMGAACERDRSRERRAAPAGREITVEAIYAPPLPDGALLRDVTWKPDGSAIAFLYPGSRDTATGEEVLELWLADPGTGQRRRLLGVDDLLRGERQTFSVEEEAQRERLRLSALGITSYLWSPDGERLLVPLSGDIWEYDLAAGSSRRLTSTNIAEFDPRYSPDGRRVAFVRGGDLFTLDLATRAERRLTSGASDTVTYATAEFIAQEELDRQRGYWWAPDSRRIAYTRVDEARVPLFPIVDYREPYGDLVRQRYPRAGDPNATVRLFVGSAEGGASVEMRIPSGPDWYLARVEWHPNGNDLVVQMMPRDQDSIQVLLVDAATGLARPFFSERGERWVDLHDDFVWLPDGDFLWTSQRTGYNHVYRYGPDGAPRHAVTGGAWPVGGIAAVDTERGWIYFTGFTQGPFDHHIYRARFDGSAADAPLGAAGDTTAALQRVSVEPGWHDPEFAPDNRRYLDTWTRAVKPPSVAVHEAGTGRRIAWVEENLEALAGWDMVEPEFRWVRPIGTDGRERADSLPALLYRPPDFDTSTKYPVVVYTYGGPGAQVATDSWITRGRALWHQLLVRRGFLVWMCDGRGSGGRGRAWIEVIHQRLGTLETEDQAACVRALWRSVPEADSTRTGIWGWSFGGYMAANSLVRFPQVWTAAAAVAPVSDWRDYDTAYTERYMELPAQNEDGYDGTAPVLATGQIVDPFFLAWGLTDDNVHPVHSVRLVNAMVADSRPVEVHVFPGRGHAIADPPARIALFRAMTAFFDQAFAMR
jgi:dipeptidyl-peptidase-4